MKIVDFPQGSKEWLEWRSGGIGASEIAILMGSNPYKTPLKLWNIKCGFSDEDPINSAMRHGIDNEAMVRVMMNQRYDLNLDPICIEDVKQPYMKASLDGWDMEKRVLFEIKCPVSYTIINEAKHHQKIPDYWYDQMQWQIMLSVPFIAYIGLWDYRTNDTTVIEILPNEERMEKMKIIAERFWLMVKRGEPPAMQKGDYLERDDKELKSLLREYFFYLQQEKFSKSKKDAVKSKILDLCKGENVKCNGFTLSQSKGRDSYDLEKMKADGIDLDKYIKKSDKGISYRINSPKVNTKENNYGRFT